MQEIWTTDLESCSREIFQLSTVLQERVLKLVRQHENVFFTGNAGTGLHDFTLGEGTKLFKLQI